MLLTTKPRQVPSNGNVAKHFSAPASCQFLHTKIDSSVGGTRALALKKRIANLHSETLVQKKALQDFHTRMHLDK
jgi:hypothetical protein